MKYRNRKWRQPPTSGSCNQIIFSVQCVILSLLNIWVSCHTNNVSHFDHRVSLSAYQQRVSGLPVVITKCKKRDVVRKKHFLRLTHGDITRDICQYGEESWTYSRAFCLGSNNTTSIFYFWREGRRGETNKGVQIVDVYYARKWLFCTENTKEG